MPDELLIAVASMAIVVGYAAICGLLAHNPGMPLWIRWPAPLWNAIAHDWRAPAPTLARPDYAKIDRLERELGLVDVEPEQPIRAAKTVCLTKNCAGETLELRTWSGMLAQRIHECETP
ncbi:hypothetical protein [Streptomyces ardesiacus]|uniref:hypothetical protein n=1 Tax=Streptomyces ardesiacus TaxID=285564 RepID=UPI003405AF6B